MKSIHHLICTAAMALTFALPLCAREFVHPGMSYTDEDLNRMRTKIAAKAEPYYSTFLALQSSPYSQVTGSDFAPVEAIGEGKFNGTVGLDGRRVHDLALLYRLTGDERYADEAVARLRRYSSLRNCSARGTAPLDNGKIYLMLEGAELLRDYEGWEADDRRAFAEMLVYPGYSDSAFPEGARDGYDDSRNGITFYWNIYNFDTGRWGNQGLFAARAMMAMGIFLDNEKIYDRALNYLTGNYARHDDIPYSTLMPRRTSLRSQSEYLSDYAVTWFDSGVQFISDEALQYYIYPNGQSQEACRDQGHAMVGVGLYTDLAEMAKTQGDDLYGALDCRILLGLEYACRYNLSYALGTPWEPSGYSASASAVSFDAGNFLRTDSRSQRWSSIAPSPEGRETAFANVRFLIQALHHYKNVPGMAPERYHWLEEAVKHTIGSGIENWGAQNHHYEWKGWGTLTKYSDGVTTEVADPVCADSPESIVYHTLSGSTCPGTPTRRGIYIRTINNKSAETILYKP
ncbi:MAG: alginate lyase family protein [Muribaculaceae bacterium]|nr:alginate lyase family protein [Muribaculaceae bacterium]